jgi:hypothetical protein
MASNPQSAKKAPKHENRSAAEAKRMTVLKKEIRRRTTSACRQVLAESDAVSTEGLSHSQESAASLGEGSTRVNLLKGMPAFTRPSR